MAVMACHHSHLSLSVVLSRIFYEMMYDGPLAASHKRHRHSARVKPDSVK